MHGVLQLAGVAWGALVLVTLNADAQERRWVRGTVTATTDDSVTVFVDGPDLNLTFTVDDASVVFAPGGVWVHPPERTRPRLSDVVRLDDAIEVHYTRKGTRNHAGVVRRSVEALEGSGRSLEGVVTARSSQTLTVEADGRQSTFTLEPSTKMTRPGLGPGPEWPPTHVIRKDDTVLVLYRAEGTALLATEICAIPRIR